MEELTERTPRPEDNDGRPEWAKRKEPSQISTPPGYVPWTSRISLVGSASVFALLIITRKQSLVRRVIAAGRKFIRQRFTKHQTHLARLQQKRHVARQDVDPRQRARSVLSTRHLSLVTSRKHFESTKACKSLRCGSFPLAFQISHSQTSNV
jgi:hypothetical protein